MIHRRFRGQSLVEVLAVVAVGAVILAFLLPSLRLAKEEARKVQCLARLQQIGLASLQYIQDNQGALVQMKHLENGVRVSYSDDLFPYLLERPLYQPNGRTVADVHYDQTQAFRCPSVDDFEPGRINSYNRQVLDYGINHYGRPSGDRNHFGSSLGVDAPGDGWPYPRMSLIANPTVIYIADAEYDSSPEDIGGAIRGANEWPIRWSFHRSAYIRHVQGYNSISLDGSARWRSGLYPSNQEWYIVRR